MNEINPRYCLHNENAMSFAEKFCICETCGQTWVRTEYAWVPDDPDFVYRKRPQKKTYRKREHG